MFLSTVRLALKWRSHTFPCYAGRALSLSSTHRSTPPDDCDIVIVGGGLVGLALASALGSRQPIRQNLRIALVEVGDLSRVREWRPPHGQFSNRVSSLTCASQDFLKVFSPNLRKDTAFVEIGVWDHVEAERTAAIEEMQVWDGISDARITFDASDLDLGPDANQMARITENANLQRALLQYLSNFPEVQLNDNIKVSSIQREKKEAGGWPLVQLSDGRVLRTRLLVGADGFNSPVRSYAGISSYGWSYEAQAIVATLVHPPRSAFELSNTKAYQRFLPTGPIAFLPLTSETSSLVWSTKPDLAGVLINCDPEILVSMINAAFRLPEVSIRYLHNVILDAQKSETPLTHMQLQSEIAFREQSHSIPPHSAYSISSSSIGIPPSDSSLVPPVVTAVQSGTVASFPLRFNHSDSYIGEGEGARTALVGDAAHTLHPLAGQGLNLGLGDVQCLFRCVEQASLEGCDVGSYTALLPFAQERYLENHMIMAVVDKLHKLYTSTSEPLVMARSVGLEVINELDFMKAAIIMAAGGGGRRRRGPIGWSHVADAIETFAGGIASAKKAGDVISKGLLGRWKQ